MSDAPCGTTAGRARHQTRNENPCGPCREAKREYQRQWRATQPAKTPNQAIIAALVAGQKVRANQAERRAAAQILTRAGRSKSQIAGQLEISTATVRRARAAMRTEARPSSPGPAVTVLEVPVAEWPGESTGQVREQG